MPNDLTALLDAMEARCAAATPPPWEGCRRDLPCLIEAGVYANGIRLMGSSAATKAVRAKADDDADFAAHARDDLPNALAALRLAVEALDSVRRFGQIAEEVHIAEKAIRAALGGGK